MSAAETALTEKNNSNVNSPQKPKRRKWFADAFVIVFCVTGAAFSFNLFRLDLFQSIATQNKKPMGAVTVKQNNVQRRFSDRVLWSRLTVDSPVYLGDLIRVAEYSAATLSINEGIVNINENSLIRIKASSDGEDRIVIDLGSGSLSITSSEDADKGVALNVMGRIIAPTAGATLSASAGESGMRLQVNEGSIIIKEKDGQSRSMEAGEALFLDTKGVEQAAPAAVVMLPHPNARLIKNSAEPLNIRFTWNAINIDQQQPLRLEIATGPNFTRIVQTTESINFSNVSLGAGTWYWRLSYQGTVLSSGQFTVIDATVSSLTSPIQNSPDYQENMPIRFEWQPIEGASYYILEASLTPDMKYPAIIKQTAIASYVEPNIEAGDWYWHVKPVFPSSYEGTTSFSKISSFKINAPVAAAASDTATSDEHISNSDAVIFSNIKWYTYNDKSSSKSNISVAQEKIGGIEKEVLTLNVHLASGSPKWAGTGTSDMKENINFIQNLKKADGVRFKALGDGKKWRIYFAASNVTDGSYHGLTISTKKGEISSFDISFNKLNQPDWAQRKIRFNKNNIKWMNIETNREINSAGGESTIKIFDFEVYPNANDSSSQAAAPISDNPETSSMSDKATSDNSTVIFSKTEWWANDDKQYSKSSVGIAVERIDGKEREVLTINTNLASGSPRWAGVATSNWNIIQKLKNTDGVRFKMLGDGSKWRVYFATTDVTDEAYHEVIISTQNGKVSNFDISFNSLNQPDWKTKPAKFNKNNIQWVAIEKTSGASNVGISSIKIFDFEIYQNESNTAQASSASNLDEFFISSNAGWSTHKDNVSRSNVSIAREKIGGVEREILTINIRLATSQDGTNNWAGARTDNIDVAQKLRNADGLRFKVLGDGKNWNVCFPTNDVSDGYYHFVTISTKNGEVSSIDIPFNKLRQSSNATRSARFNKNNIIGFELSKNLKYGGTSAGESFIKVFDFETY